MKLKPILGNIIYSIGFVFLFIIISKVSLYFDEMQSQTYRIFPWVIYANLIYILIGLYLRLPNFLKNFKKPGKWKVNLNNILFICIPMLYISFYHYLPFSYPIPDILIHTTGYFRFGSIITGYFLLNSIKKDY